MWNWLIRLDKNTAVSGFFAELAHLVLFDSFDPAAPGPGKRGLEKIQKVQRNSDLKSARPASHGAR